MNYRRCSLVLLLCLSVLPIIAQPAGEIRPDVPRISGPALLEHVRILSSDEYEGRSPGTAGEERTVRYIVDQFRKAGLKPAGADGSFLQKVPLVGITPAPGALLRFQKDGREQVLRFKDDFVAWTKRVTEEVRVDRSEVVFAGYGIQAPEFQWDDFKGTDLKGKTLVVLVGDPPVPDPAAPDRLDPNLFGGKAMTYYGRWTYKYEQGARLGAAAVLIVHETGPAGYPFAVVQNKVTEQFDLVTADQNRGRAAIEGWISLEQARKLMALAGQDYDRLKKEALQRQFQPRSLGVQVSVALRNSLRTVESHNVAGIREGVDPGRKGEYVIYTSHWDHLGIGPEVGGDRVYHGAVDNATGIGGLIELARAFTEGRMEPRRSVLFLAVTAEEQGLLGSEYYAGHPLFPLARTAAVINMDGLNVHGKTRDITVTGLGYSDLDDVARQVASGQGRVLVPDPTPEKGSYFRSDHFPFARKGVPALASGGGVDYIGRPPEYGKKITEDYIANDYHKPSDRIRPDWDLSGAVEDLQFYFLVGWRVAQSDRLPEWKPGSPFKAASGRPSGIHSGPPPGTSFRFGYRAPGSFLRSIRSSS